MSEKFENIVNWPHRALKRAKDRLLGWDIESENPQVIFELGDKTRTLTIPVRQTKKGIKGAAVGVTGFAQFLFWASKYLLLDNHATRGLEKGLASVKAKGKNGKKTKRQKFKNPNLMGHSIYYFLIAMILIGADLTRDEKSIVKKGAKKVKENLMPMSRISIDDFEIDPGESQENWEKQVKAIEPYVVAHLFSTEGFVEGGYLDNGASGTLTIGAGFTLGDETHIKFATKVLGRPIGNGSKVTVAEARKLIVEWCNQKIYPKMKQVFTAKIPARTFISLVVAAYNAGENTFADGNSGADVRDAVNAGVPTNELVKKFVRAYGKIRKTQWGGMPNKYAVCAYYMMDKLSDEDILNAIGEAPYTLEQVLKADMGYKQAYDSKTMKNGRLLIYDGKGAYAKPKDLLVLDNLGELIQKTKYRKTYGTVQEPVKDYMTAREVEVMSKGRIFRVDEVDFENYEDLEAAVVVEMDESDVLNQDGEILFHKKEYKKAIAKFEESLAKNPDNYIVYSNLSIAYYRDGNYEQGLKVVQDLINSDKMSKMPKDIKGYTYYNAALCREKLGDNAIKNAQKLEHYSKAKANLELAKKFSKSEYHDFEERITQKIQRLSNKRCNGKIAFNDATERVANRGLTADFMAVYEKIKSEGLV